MMVAVMVFTKSETCVQVEKNAYVLFSDIRNNVQLVFMKLKKVSRYVVKM